MSIDLAPQTLPWAPAAESDGGRVLVQTLIDHLQLALVKADLADALYHAVVIPDEGAHVFTTFATSEELAEYLRGLEGQDVRVRLFYGRALGVTRRPRYLVTHEGRFPLFAVSEGGEIDASGSLARAVHEPAATAVAPPQEVVDQGDLDDPGDLDEDLDGLDEDDLDEMDESEDHE